MKRTGHDEDGILVKRTGQGEDGTHVERTGQSEDGVLVERGKEKICTLMAVICKIITIFAGYMNDGQ